MNEQPKKVYTMEDNVKSLFFQNKDIIKALEEIKQKLGIKPPQQNDFDSPAF